MSSVKDVAKLAGVSPSTVSRYIRNACNISDAKKELIQKSIKQLGYVPSINASILKSNRSNFVGLILPSEHNHFFSLLISRLYQSLSGSKKLIVLYYRDNEDVKANISTLLSLKVSSVLFIPLDYSESIARLAESNACYFLQLFSDCFPKFDALTINDTLGTYLAVKKLIELGHEKILLVDKQNNVFKERYKGYVKAFSEHGKKVDEKGALVLNGGENLEPVLIGRINDYKPTAIICVTEILSQECCGILQSHGISIPKDLSLITYDDSMWAKLSGHTAVCQPIDEITQNIITLINGQTSEKLTPSKIVIDPVIIERNSCKDLTK